MLLILIIVIIISHFRDDIIQLGTAVQTTRRSSEHISQEVYSQIPACDMETRLSYIRQMCSKLEKEIDKEKMPK